jgi:hypothetical protein
VDRRGFCGLLGGSDDGCRVDREGRIDFQGGQLGLGESFPLTDCLELGDMTDVTGGI